MGRVLKLKEKQVVRMFRAIGFLAVDQWSFARLADRVNKLYWLVEDGWEPTDPKARKLIKTILSAIHKKMEIVVMAKKTGPAPKKGNPRKAPPAKKTGRKVEDDEEEEEEEEDEEEETEEDDDDSDDGGDDEDDEDGESDEDDEEDDEEEEEEDNEDDEDDESDEDDDEEEDDDEDDDSDDEEESDEDSDEEDSDEDDDDEEEDEDSDEDDEDSDEDDEEDEDDMATKTKKGGKKTGNKAGKSAKKPDGKKKETGPGIIATIIEILSGASKEKPVTKEKIVKLLMKKFKDRDESSLQSTVNQQVPNKLNTEKNLNVQANAEKPRGYWIGKGGKKKEEKKPKKKAKK